MQEQKMTVREVYENLLRELNKVNAPSLHLEDYNYFINRGITEYINRRYNLYDTSQQTTDDLQVLTGNASIDAETGIISGSTGKGGQATEDRDGVASLSGTNMQLSLDVDTDPLKPDLVYRNGQSAVPFIVDSMSGMTDAPQFTIMFIIINSNTSFTFTHTDRKVAVAGDMVLLGNADSVLNYVEPAGVGSGNTYAGKSFKNEGGILIEVPFSGEGQLNLYKPQVTTRDGVPQTNFKLPRDYYHMLNCVVNFETLVKFKCYPAGSVQPFTARRLTSDMYAAIINNAFMRPDYRRPYFYIQNDVETSVPSMDIRAGSYQAVFKLKSVNIDYLKQPQVIVLTTLQRDSLNDTSQIMEFPNYVNNEIIKIATSLVMENASDPRVQTHIPVNQSIPNQPPGVPAAK